MTAVSNRDVFLLEVPLALHARTVQWHADLMREFALIQIADSQATDSDDSAGDVPSRLLTVFDELLAKYEMLADEPTHQLEEAHRRGEVSADVTYTLPPEAADDLEHLEELLDEADAFCRRGELLTLAAQPDLAAFRRWFLRQLAEQLRGAEPTPWPAWAACPPDREAGV